MEIIKLIKDNKEAIINKIQSTAVYTLLPMEEVLAYDIYISDNGELQVRFYMGEDRLHNTCGLHYLCSLKARPIGETSFYNHLIRQEHSLKTNVSYSLIETFKEEYQQWERMKCNEVEEIMLNAENIYENIILANYKGTIGSDEKN